MRHFLPRITHHSFFLLPSLRITLSSLRWAISLRKVEMDVFNISANSCLLIFGFSLMTASMESWRSFKGSSVGVGE